MVDVPSLPLFQSILSLCFCFALLCSALLILSIHLACSLVFGLFLCAFTTTTITTTATTPLTTPARPHALEPTAQLLVDPC